MFALNQDITGFLFCYRASGSNPFDPHAHSQYAGEKLQVGMTVYPSVNLAVCLSVHLLNK